MFENLSLLYIKIARKIDNMYYIYVTICLERYYYITSNFEFIVISYKTYKPFYLINGLKLLRAGDKA